MEYNWEPLDESVELTDAERRSLNNSVLDMIEWGAGERQAIGRSVDGFIVAGVVTCLRDDEFIGITFRYDDDADGDGEGRTIIVVSTASTELVVQ